MFSGVVAAAGQLHLTSKSNAETQRHRGNAEKAKKEQDKTWESLVFVVLCVPQRLCASVVGVEFFKCDCPVMITTEAEL